VQQAAAAHGRALPLRVVFRVLADVLAGLHYAHTRVDTFGRPMRIVHRDVNPRNIMLSVRGEVKLIDFGVARADTRQEHTVGDTIKGKFAYMAPEQIDNTGAVDARADLFAVGLVLHELVAGSNPFVGMREVQIMHRLLSGRLPPLDEVPGHPAPEMVRAVHQKALALHRDDRYRSAAELREAILACAAPLGGPASPEELVAFLREVAPESVDDVTARLRAWKERGGRGGAGAAAGLGAAEPSASVSRAAPARAEATMALPPVVAPAPESRSVPSGTFAGTAARPARALPWVAIGVLAVVIPGLLLVIAGSGAAAFFLMQEGPAPGPVAAPVAPAPAAVAAPAEAAAPVTPGEAAAPAPPAAVPAGKAKAERAAPASPRPAAAVPSAPAPSAPAPSAPAPASAPPPPEAAPAPAAPAPAPAPAAPAATPPAAAAPAPAAETGFLFVSSAPADGFEVWVDGRRVGLTPLRNHRLPAGDHEVVVKDPASGRSWRESVTVSRATPSRVTVSP